MLLPVKGRIKLPDIKKIEEKPDCVIISGYNFVLITNKKTGSFIRIDKDASTHNAVTISELNHSSERIATITGNITMRSDVTAEDLKDVDFTMIKNHVEEEIRKMLYYGNIINELTSKLGIFTKVILRHNNLKVKELIEVVDNNEYSDTKYNAIFLFEMRLIQI